MNNLEKKIVEKCDVFKRCNKDCQDYVLVHHFEYDDDYKESTAMCIVFSSHQETPALSLIFCRNLLDIHLYEYLGKRKDFNFTIIRKN